METKRLITEQVKEEIVGLIIEQVVKHQLAISNFNDISWEVVKHLEDNAVMGVDLSEMKDLTMVSQFLYTSEVKELEKKEEETKMENNNNTKYEELKKELNVVQLNDMNIAAGPIGKYIENLEKRVAALEAQIQAKPSEVDNIPLLDRVMKELEREVRSSNA